MTSRRNAKAPDEQLDELAADSMTVAASQLRSLIERVERLAEERKAISDDIREVFREVKGAGFDVTAVRTLIRLRAMDKEQRQEREAIVDLYKNALGMD